MPDKATLALERTLEAVEGAGAGYSLTVWEGALISGHGDGHVRSWNVVTGASDQDLEGHDDAVHALAVCG